jgi:hypothetical protein
LISASGNVSDMTTIIVTSVGLHVEQPFLGATAAGVAVRPALHRPPYVLTCWSTSEYTPTGPGGYVDSGYR